MRIVCRRKGASPKLQRLLLKVNGKKLPKHTPMDYSNADRTAAKTILNRLLSPPPKREVSYIREVPVEDNEY